MVIASATAAYIQLTPERNKPCVIVMDAPTTAVMTAAAAAIAASMRATFLRHGSLNKPEATAPNIMPKRHAVTKTAIVKTAAIDVGTINESPSSSFPPV